MYCALGDEAADEIERLRAAVDACADYGDKQVAEIERLRVLLKECADRFERRCRSAGNDAETAAASVSKYRAAVLDANPPALPQEAGGDYRRKDG